VVGKGGIAGVGETYRALPWQTVKLVAGGIIAKFDDAGLDQLEPIDPKDWPTRPAPAAA
jgi:hypothetical protein